MNSMIDHLICVLIVSHQYLCGLASVMTTTSG